MADGSRPLQPSDAPRCLLASLSPLLQVEGTTERPRLAVFRSNNHIYAQVCTAAVAGAGGSSGSSRSRLCDVSWERCHWPAMHAADACAGTEWRWPWRQAAAGGPQQYQASFTCVHPAHNLHAPLLLLPLPLPLLTLGR